METLYTVEEVAEQLKVHPETVRRWLRGGQLSGYRISRRGGWRIKAESVAAMLARMAPSEKSEPPTVR